MGRVAVWTLGDIPDFQIAFRETCTIPSSLLGLFSCPCSGKSLSNTPTVGKSSLPRCCCQMIILAEHQGASKHVHSGVREWSHLPDIHWFPHYLYDFYKEYKRSMVRRKKERRWYEWKTESMYLSIHTLKKLFLSAAVMELGKLLGIQRYKWYHVCPPETQVWRRKRNHSNSK